MIEMQGYIKIPKWVDINLISKKTRVGEFLKRVVLNPNQTIDIKYIVSEYYRDEEACKSLIDELVFRGFELVCEGKRFCST